MRNYKQSVCSDCNPRRSNTSNIKNAAALITLAIQFNCLFAFKSPFLIWSFCHDVYLHNSVTQNADEVPKTCECDDSSRQLLLNCNGCECDLIALIFICLITLCVCVYTISSMLVAPTLRRRALCASVNCCICHDVNPASLALRRSSVMTSLST